MSSCASDAGRIRAAVAVVLAFLADRRERARLAAVAPAPLWVHDDVVDAVTDAIGSVFDIFGAVQDALAWLVNTLVEAILNAISTFFVGMTKSLLFFRKPNEVEGLTELYHTSLKLYLAILFLSTMAFLVVMQVFPNDERADPYRFVERVLMSMIIVLVGPQILVFFLTLTNTIAAGLYPASFDLGDTVIALQVMVGDAAGPFIALFLVIFAGTGTVISGIVFLCVLAVRMLFIYTIYAMFPIIMAFWVVDIGPARYVKSFADFAIRLTAILLLFSIFASAFLWVGSVVEVPEDADVDGASAAATQNMDPYGPDRTGGHFASSGTGAAFLVLLFRFGTLWLLIALGASSFLFAMASGVSRRNWHRMQAAKHQGDAFTSVPGPGGGGGTIPGSDMAGVESGPGPVAANAAGYGVSVAGADPAPGNQAFDQGQVAQLNNGDTVAVSPEGGGTLFKGPGGGVESFSLKQGDNPLANYDGHQFRLHSPSGVPADAHPATNGPLSAEGGMVGESGLSGSGFEQPGLDGTESMEAKGLSGKVGSKAWGAGAVVGSKAKGIASTSKKMFQEDDPLRAAGIGASAAAEGVNPRGNAARARHAAGFVATKGAAGAAKGAAGAESVYDSVAGEDETVSEGAADDGGFGGSDDVHGGDSDEADAGFARNDEAREPDNDEEELYGYDSEEELEEGREALRDFYEAGHSREDLKKDSWGFADRKGDSGGTETGTDNVYSSGGDVDNPSTDDGFDPTDASRNAFYRGRAPTRADAEAESEMSGADEEPDDED